MSCECICYCDCIIMVSVQAMCIRTYGVNLYIYLSSFMCICVSYHVLWTAEWAPGVIKGLLSQLCRGSCPGSGMVMDGMACQSLGSLLASGTEVALLNTTLPRLSPNTTAHFKVNCLCGAVSLPPRGTRLLFVWNLYRSLPTGVFWYEGVAGWCLALCRHTEAQTHTCSTWTQAHIRTHTAR